MSVGRQRQYEGESSNGNFEEALNEALHGLDKDLGEGGVQDASATWVVTEVTGSYARIGSHSTKVKIAAVRHPEWNFGQPSVALPP